jgi:hypothetical protein
MSFNPSSLSFDSMASLYSTEDYPGILRHVELEVWILPRPRSSVDFKSFIEGVAGVFVSSREGNMVVWWFI